MNIAERRSPQSISDRDCYGKIKEMLHEWAGWHEMALTAGYPHFVAFMTERVQDRNRSTETMRYMPDDIVRLDKEVEKLAPAFKRIISSEYNNRGLPQKSKAARLGIGREEFSRKLQFAHEQLTFVMFSSVTQFINGNDVAQKGTINL